MAEVELKFSLITDSQIWQNFVCSSSWYTFLHSWEWGNLQQSFGQKIFRIGCYLDNELVGVGLIIKITARRGCYLLCPHGPLFLDSLTAKEFFKQWTSYLHDLGKTEQADFIRLSTILPSTVANGDMLHKLGYFFAPMHVHAETTWLLDLNEPAQELFVKMRKTSRYLITRAQKEGVKIIKSDNNDQDIEKFYQLHLKHSKQNNYEAFSKTFIQKLFKFFLPNQISLKFAVYNDVVEAASIIIFYGQGASYYLAATNILHPKFSPSYLLQWHSILEAIKNGCTVYNFWGVSPNDNPKHPLAGVSLFKKGFGGREVDLLHAYDLPLSCKYYFNWLIETARRIKRGYYFIKPK
ncbi:MAG: peptidoglycan bridge formation glycyltransferase FemA/FemB family protein [Patescibacteria group bacterium]|jgi:lipid II:glycine glycyltransferase (peptidoglycan interpeptide bridge formation enzyme)